jgi:hypothetical protein
MDTIEWTRNGSKEWTSVTKEWRTKEWRKINLKKYKKKYKIPRSAQKPDADEKKR